MASSPPNGHTSPGSPHGLHERHGLGSVLLITLRGHESPGSPLKSSPTPPRLEIMDYLITGWRERGWEGEGWG